MKNLQPLSISPHSSGFGESRPLAGTRLPSRWTSRGASSLSMSLPPRTTSSSSMVIFPSDLVSAQVYIICDNFKLNVGYFSGQNWILHKARQKFSEHLVVSNIICCDNYSLLSTSNPTLNSRLATTLHHGELRRCLHHSAPAPQPPGARPDLRHKLPLLLHEPRKAPANRQGEPFRRWNGWNPQTLRLAQLRGARGGKSLPLQHQAEHMAEIFPKFSACLHRR